ncbi:MAG TPA: hypothetical protein VFD58_05535 [Blastocatellia bacterium]|nr:hypothetical protein [Blastocatellia bacterium]
MTEESAGNYTQDHEKLLLTINAAIEALDQVDDTNSALDSALRGGADIEDPLRALRIAINSKAVDATVDLMALRGILESGLSGTDPSSIPQLLQAISNILESEKLPVAGVKDPGKGC